MITKKGTTYNAYVETENNNKLWKYIESCSYDLKRVKQRILYEIWKYSHGKRGEFKMKIFNKIINRSIENYILTIFKEKINNVFNTNAIYIIYEETKENLIIKYNYIDSFKKLKIPKHLISVSKLEIIDLFMDNEFFKQIKERFEEIERR